MAVILNRDLQASRIPRHRASQLRSPGEGHERAWADIWRFARSFDPERYAEQVGELDSAAVYEHAKREAAAQAQLTGSLSELRAALRLSYDDGFGAFASATVIDSLLDAIHAAIAAGATRPQASRPPRFEPPIGLFGASLGTGQHRIWFASRRPRTREELFDRAAGLLLREISEGVILSVLYLYAPGYAIEGDGPVSHVLMLLLEPRPGSETRTEAVEAEYESLSALLIADLADPKADHYPTASERSEAPSLLPMSPATLPRTSTGFAKVEMPERFVLEFLTGTGEWMDWGLFDAALFEREADGSYVCIGHGGSPLILRCLRQEGPVLYVIDGAGDPFTYRLVPFPGGGYS